MSNLTLGELLEKIRSQGLNPEPTGNSPYSGIEAGTYDATAVPGVDDFSEDLKESIGKYTNKVTTGEGRTENANIFPTAPSISDFSMVDPTSGNPAPLRRPTIQQKTFIRPSFGDPTALDSKIDPKRQSEIDKAFQILDELGFFGNIDDIMDKNAQINGHYILNSQAVEEKISQVLTNNRFNMYSHENPYSVSNFEADPATLSQYKNQEDGTEKDNEDISNLAQVGPEIMKTGVIPKEMFPKYGKQIEQQTSGDLPHGLIGKEALRGNQKARVKRRFDEPRFNNEKPNPNYSTVVKPNKKEPYHPGNKYSDQNNLLKRLANIAAIEAIKVFIKALAKILDQVVSVEKLATIAAAKHLGTVSAPSKLTYGSYNGRKGKGDNAETVYDEEGNAIRRSNYKQKNDATKLLTAIGIPYPNNTIRFFTTSTKKVSWESILSFGLNVMAEKIKSDPIGSGYYSGFIEKLKEDFSEENNFGLPEISAAELVAAAAGAGAAALVNKIPGVSANATSMITGNEALVDAFAKAPAIKMVAAIIRLSESATMGKNADGKYSFSGIRDLSRLPNGPANRLASDVRPSQLGLSSRNVPSMFLLPKPFTRAFSQTAKARGPSFLSQDIPGGFHPNTSASPELKQKNTFDLLTQSGGIIRLGASAAAAAAAGSNLALTQKIGSNANSVKSNHRFSKDEVEAMENVLEAELLPFYFHDLRTNEIVAFHAFLNSLSDSFAPSYNASSGFGRIDDVQIYQKTSRSIAIDFSLIAMSQADMKEMYFKINKLVTMVYPQFSRGTLLELADEDGVTRFTQPFSQVTTATPVIRLRVGDLIKGNYSREGLSRIMGIDGEDFQIVEAPEQTAEEEAQEELAEVNKITIKYSGYEDMNDSMVVGAVEDMEEVYPVGTTVLLKPGKRVFGALDKAGEVASPFSDANEDFFLKLKGLDFTNAAGREVEGGFCVEIMSYPTSVILDDFDERSRVYDMPLLVKISSKTVNRPGWTTPQIFGKTKNQSGDQIDIKQGYISYGDIDHYETALATVQKGANPAIYTTPAQGEDPNKDKKDSMFKVLFSDANPLFRSFESTTGRGLAGVITSLNFDWGLNSEINWDLSKFGYKAPQGCKISISFTPIHDIVPGLDHNGMMRAPVFNVAESGPHPKEDPHGLGGYARRGTASGLLSKDEE